MLHFQEVSVTTDAAVGPKQNDNEWELASLIIIPSILSLREGEKQFVFWCKNEVLFRQHGQDSIGY